MHPWTGEPVGVASSDLEVFGRGLAAVGHEFVFDHLAFVEGAETRPLDGGDVDEHVLVPGRRTDEAVALSRIEPFDGALLHRLSPSQSERLVNARMRSLRSAR